MIILLTLLLKVDLSTTEYLSILPARSTRVSRKHRIWISSKCLVLHDDH
jgi:hypothetical protein